MKKLIHSIFVGLLCCMLLSCVEPSVTEDTSGLKEVRIAVVLPEKDRALIWDNALGWAAENIRKAGIGVKVVYERILSEQIKYRGAYFDVHPFCEQKRERPKSFPCNDM